MSDAFNFPCMRCGDSFALDVTDAYMPCVCHACFDKGLAALGSGDEPDVDALARWRERHMRGRERHPTWLALVSALGSGDGPW